MMGNKTFSDAIYEARLKSQLTGKDIINKLIALDKNPGKGNKKIFSRAYLCKIETQNEIPTPDMICMLAEILGLSAKELLSLAKATKIKQYDEKVSLVYHKALGLYLLGLDAKKR